MALIVNGRYNFISQDERLIYIGKDGIWHQFAKIDEPNEVWAEITDHDLYLIEETKDEASN